MEKKEKYTDDSYELPNRVLDTIPEPLVTVFTITYQQASYINNCIESVLKQKTMFPVEYIISDDCSTDGTREIVFEYARKYPDSIRAITADHNIGAIPNGRRCLRAARGKYVAICEGDDYWIDPNKLQTQVMFLEDNPDYGLVYTEFDSLNVKTGKYEESRFKNRLGIHKNTFEDFLVNAWFLAPCTWLIRRELIQDFDSLVEKFDDGPDDLKLLLLLSSRAKIQFFDKSTAVYRVLENSASHFKDKPRSFQQKNSIFRIKRFFIGQNNVSQDIVDKVADKFYGDILSLSCLLNDIIAKEKSFRHLKARKLLNHKKYILYYISKVAFFRRILFFYYNL